jgi:hypothetical protein
MGKLKITQFRILTILILATLAACSGGNSGAPTFSLNTPDPRASGSRQALVPVFEDAPFDDSQVWPEALMGRQILRCQYVREDEKTSHILSSFSLLASPLAGSRLSFFRDSESQRILSDLRSFGTLSKSLVFTASRRVGTSTGLLDQEDAVFVADLSALGRGAAYANAEVWAVLPLRRLSQSQWSSRLPLWLERRDTLKVESEPGGVRWILPEQKKGLNYKLYSQDESGVLSPLGESIVLGPVKDSFPVALNSVAEAAIFQGMDPETLSPRLEWVNTKNGSRFPVRVANAPQLKILYFVSWTSNLAEASFWAWAENGAQKELVQLRYELRHEGQTFNRVNTLGLVSKDHSLMLLRDSEWLAVDTQNRRISILDTSFQVKESFPFPTEVDEILSVQPISKNVWLMGSINKAGLHQARLLHRSLAEWRGPLSKGACKSPTLQ